MSCLFCRIIAGEIPSRKIFEDATTYAFMDIHPGTRGHALVIPKVHATDVHDIAPDALADVARTAQRIARAAKASLACDGVNLVQSSGAAAFQSVFHLHVHVIPRYVGDDVRLPWTPRPGDATSLEETAALLRAALG